VRVTWTLTATTPNGVTYTGSGKTSTRDFPNTLEMSVSLWSTDKLQGSDGSVLEVGQAGKRNTTPDLVRRAHPGQQPGRLLHRRKLPQADTLKPLIHLHTPAHVHAMPVAPLRLVAGWDTSVKPQPPHDDPDRQRGERCSGDDYLV